MNNIAFLEGAEYEHAKIEQLRQRIDELTAALTDSQARNGGLHDALERQSEVISALRVEIATKDKRINELEAENESLQESLDSKGMGMWEVVAMKDRALGEYAQIVVDLKAQIADGRTYAEGCKP